MRTLLVFLLFCPTAGADAESVLGLPGFDPTGFIEYQAGDLPIILTAPHGGHDQPAHLPIRSSGVLDSDAHTQELARTIAAVFHADTGRHLHLVVCRLHRSRLDANRDLPEAAENDPTATAAWQAYHGFIETACATSVKQHGAAFLIDLHGHGHKAPRVELGYVHSSLDLADCEERLNEPDFAQRGTLALIQQRSSAPYSDLLHGPASLGALLEQRSFLATPSPRQPIPDEPFFRGGYTVQRHCQADRQITGLQIEANRPRLRDTAHNRLAFARALLGASRVYLKDHLQLDLEPASAPIVPSPPQPPGHPAQ